MLRYFKLALGAIALLMGILPTGDASAAGDYAAFLCRLPNGDPAPAGPWSGPVTNACASGGDLVLRLPDGSNLYSSVSTSLTAPADTTITRAELWRDLAMPVSYNTAQPSLSSSWEARGYAGGGYSGDFASNPYTPPSGVFAANAGIVRTGPLNVLSATITCAFLAPAELNQCTGGGTWTVHKLDVMLRDTGAPSVTSPPTGDLLDGTWHTTPATGLDLGAADQGGGVYRAFVREGTTTVYANVDATSATCRDAAAGNAEAHEFTSLTPCRTATTAYHPVFDLSGLGDGVHTVALGVEDAAGNETLPVGFGAKTVRVNTPGGTLGDPGQACAGGTYDVSGACSGGGGTPPGGGGGGGGGVTPAGGGGTPVSGGGVGTASSGGPIAPLATGAAASAEHRPNGLNASAGGSLVARFASTERRQLRIGYGRPVTLTGQLVNARGVPVAHGLVEVITFTRLPGAQPVRLSPVTSDEQGHFRTTVPAGPSRLVRLGYRAYLDDLDFSQTSELDLRVISAARLSAAPGHLRNGHAVRFRGSVRGAPVGSRKVIEMQVRQGPRWVTFGTTRLRGGSFSYRYRFTRTFKPARYAFRAIVRGDAGWPYETGTSGVRVVRVRP